MTINWIFRGNRQYYRRFRGIFWNRVADFKPACDWRRRKGFRAVSDRNLYRSRLSPWDSVAVHRDHSVCKTIPHHQLAAARLRLPGQLKWLTVPRMIPNAFTWKAVYDSHVLTDMKPTGKTTVRIPTLTKSVESRAG